MKFLLIHSGGLSKSLLRRTRTLTSRHWRQVSGCQQSVELFQYCVRQASPRVSCVFSMELSLLNSMVNGDSSHASTLSQRQ
jgi:hypothetical protein